MTESSHSFIGMHFDDFGLPLWSNGGYIFKDDD